MHNKLVIFSAPSGAGKTTIVRHLLEQLPDLAFSVSACSRKKRPHEIEGKDYYFVSADDFREKSRTRSLLNGKKSTVIIFTEPLKAK
jgi:guanylate kinase